MRGLSGLLLLAMLTPASAKEIRVEMLNQGKTGMMVFEPAFVQARVGDTVRFVPTNAGHNAETIPGMVPDGVQHSIGGMGQDLVLKLEKAGLYGIKCKPHYSMGMVALVQVGKDPANLIAAKSAKLAPLAAKRMNEYLAQVK